MSEAPERIFATHDHNIGYYFTALGNQPLFSGVEYIRADLAYTRADIEAVLEAAGRVAYEHFVRTNQLRLGYSAHDAIRNIDIDAVLKGAGE